MATESSVEEPLLPLYCVRLLMYMVSTRSFRIHHAKEEFFMAGGPSAPIGPTRQSVERASTLYHVPITHCGRQSKMCALLCFVAVFTPPNDAKCGSLEVALGELAFGLFGHIAEEAHRHAHNRRLANHS